MNAVFSGNCQKCLRQIGQIHIHSGYIDGYYRERISFFLPNLKQGTHLLPDVLIQLGNKIVFLKQRNELTRRKLSPLGMYPANQSLCADHAAVAQIVFWLEIDGKLPFG